MECNKEEGLRAMDIAKRKLSESDYVGAKKFGVKAQNLYPNLDGLRQILLMIDVFIGSKESDWYGILGVDPLADEETLKRHYKKLALLLHPDKNRIDGAEDAFKLVSEAWCLLSDKSKRLAYDQKRRRFSEQVHQQKRKSDDTKKPFKPTSRFERESTKRRFVKIRKRFTEKQKAYASAANKRRVRSWLEKAQKDMADAIAAAVARENKEEAERLIKKRKTTTRDDAYAANQAQEKIKRWYEKSQKHVADAIAAAVARGNTYEAERVFKKPKTTTGCYI